MLFCSFCGCVFVVAMLCCALFEGMLRWVPGARCLVLCYVVLLCCVALCCVVFLYWCVAWFPSCSCAKFLV